MRGNLYRLTEARSIEVCIFPCIGEMLYDYIVGLVADMAAEELKDHLLDCAYCRELYLNLLSLRGTMSTSKAKRADEDTSKIGNMKILSFTAFKKAIIKDSILVSVLSFLCLQLSQISFVST